MNGGKTNIEEHDEDMEKYGPRVVRGVHYIVGMNT